MAPPVKVLAHVLTICLFWSSLLAAGLYILATFETRKGYYTTMYALVTLVTIRYSWELIVEFFGLSSSTDEIENKRETKDTHAIDKDLQDLDLEETEVADEKLHPEEEQHHPIGRSQRVPFLANIKSFMVFCVVVGHVVAGFGAIGPRWQFAVGVYDNNFLRVALSIFSLIQGFIMPMFFFVSAYFTAGSYGRKGAHNFLLGKAKRLLIPALFAFFIIVPLCKMLGQYVGEVDIEYMPNAGPGWFIFWLLTFDWLYSSFYEALRPIQDIHESDSHSSDTKKKMPGTLVRMAYGLGFCGFLSFLLFYLLQQTSKNYNLAGMPIAVGSLPPDIFLYAVGIYARHNNWLDGNIRDHLDIPLWVLRLMAAMEFALMMAMMHLLLDNPQRPNHVIYRVLYMTGAGLYCVDASLVTVDLFQTHFNFENKITKFFAEQAYAVYLTHVFVVVSWTVVFVQVYNQLATTPLTFLAVPGGFTFSPTMLEGGTDGALTLGLGFLAVCAITQLTAWPLAWCIRQIPGVSQFI